MKHKKAQSAFELVSTYGWIFLVSAIAVAGIAYYGYFDPLQFSPDKCEAPEGFDCIGKARIDSAGGNSQNHVEFVLKNNRGFPLTIYDASVSGRETTIVSAQCGLAVHDGHPSGAGHIMASTAENGDPPEEPQPLDFNGLSVQNGDLVRIKAFCVEDFDDKAFKIDLTFFYELEDTGIATKANVHINSRAQDYTQ